MVLRQNNIYFKLLDVFTTVFITLSTLIISGKQLYHMHFGKWKRCSMFLSSYRNRSESLGEREMLWEHEPQESVSMLFRVLPNFHEFFTNSIERERDFYFCFRKHREEKKKKTCWLWLSKCIFSLLESSLSQQLVLFSSVSPASYRSTIFNQSACLFS